MRLIANVPVAFHVITTLWFNKIGEKFDRLLSNNSYGNRIRRHKDQTPNLNALGSFKPYLHHYQAWRDNGLKAIRENLKHEKSIVAVTADFVAFYHNISADFIVSDTFLKELGITLSSEEKNFTSLIVEMLSKWAKSTPLGRGLPVGCSISAVIANTALIFFDRCIEKDLVPLYYGRYVDDFVIVHQDKGFLISLIPKLREFIKAELNLMLHPKKIYLQHYSKGVKFIGAVVKPNREYIGNRTKGKLYAKLTQLNKELEKNPNPSPDSIAQAVASINSYLGFMIHYKTFKIRKRMLENVLDKKWLKYLKIDENMKKVEIKKFYKLNNKAIVKLKNKKKRRKKFMKPSKLIDSVMGG